MLLYLGKDCSIFSWKDFRIVVKNALCVSMETICGRKFFCEKIFFLLISNIGPCVCHFWNFLAWICQNCIQNVQFLFEENFVGKNFIVTLGLWSKIFWYFIGDFLADLSKCNIQVQGYFLRKNAFIREKKQFLLSCSDTDPILFRPFVNIFSTGSSKLNHKCPIAIPGNKFFWKNFWSVSELERMCSSFFSKKIQS